MDENKPYDQRVTEFIAKLDKLYPNGAWVTKFARNTDLITFAYSFPTGHMSQSATVRGDLASALMNLVERFETLKDKPKVPEKIDDLGIILEVWERTIDGRKSKEWRLTACFMATEALLSDLAVRFGTTTDSIRDKFVGGHPLVNPRVFWKPQKARGSAADPLMM